MAFFTRNSITALMFAGVFGLAWSTATEVSADSKNEVSADSKKKNHVRDCDMTGDCRIDYIYEVWVQDHQDHDLDVEGALGYKCADIYGKALNNPADRTRAMICADPNLARQARIIQRIITKRQWEYSFFRKDIGDEEARVGLKRMRDKQENFLKALASCDGNRNCILDLQRFRICELTACYVTTEGDAVEKYWKEQKAQMANRPYEPRTLANDSSDAIQDWGDQSVASDDASDQQSQMPDYAGDSDDASDQQSEMPDYAGHSAE